MSDEDVKKITEGILSADREEQLIAVQTAADILSDCEISTIDLLITAGVIPKLVEFLGFDDNCNLLVESVSVIQGITCGTAEHVKAIVDAAAISSLKALLASTDTDVLHSAVATLANIADCGAEFRNHLFSEGVVVPLVVLIGVNVPENLAKEISRALSNLCLDADPCTIDRSIARELMCGLSRLINFNSETILAKVCSALCCLTDKFNEDYIQALLNATGMVERLLELLSSNRMTESSDLPLQLIGIVCNITASTSSNCNIMVEKGFVAPTMELLRSPRSDMVRSAVCILSNVIQDGPELRNGPIAEGVINSLITSLHPNSSVELMRDVAVFLNYFFCHNTPKDLPFVREILPALEQLIQINDDDIIVDTCLALNYLSSREKNDLVQVSGLILDSIGILPRLVELISRNTTEKMMMK